MSLTDVGPTWGSQITKKAIIAVIVFFIVVVLYISFRFEWKMAIAALIAVIHDLLVTAGIYSLFGFQVTPDTVIALLTILGYSLYDTVVVFDRVKENTQGPRGIGPDDLRGRRQPVDEPDARPVDQHLARGHPARVVGARHRRPDPREPRRCSTSGWHWSSGSRQGAYSSIFIASPVLAVLKEREPRYVNIRRKLANRTEGSGLLTPRQAATLNAAASPTGTRGDRVRPDVAPGLPAPDRRAAPGRGVSAAAGR